MIAQIHVTRAQVRAVLDQFRYEKGFQGEGIETYGGNRARGIARNLGAYNHT